MTTLGACEDCKLELISECFALYIVIFIEYLGQWYEPPRTKLITFRLLIRLKKHSSKSEMPVECLDRDEEVRNADLLNFET